MKYFPLASRLWATVGADLSEVKSLVHSLIAHFFWPSKKQGFFFNLVVFSWVKPTLPKAICERIVDIAAAKSEQHTTGYRMGTKACASCNYGRTKCTSMCVLKDTLVIWEILKILRYIDLMWWSWCALSYLTSNTCIGALMPHVHISVMPESESSRGIKSYPDSHPLGL